MHLERCQSNTSLPFWLGNTNDVDVTKVGKTVDFEFFSKLQKFVQLRCFDRHFAQVDEFD